MAHDLNNILSGIVSYPELLLMDLPESSGLRKPILTIKKSGEKAAAIVQDLLSLARREVASRKVVSLNSAVRDYLKSPEFETMEFYHEDVPWRAASTIPCSTSGVAGSPFKDGNEPRLQCR